MATAASIALSASTVKPGALVTVTCTVSNAGGSAVTVTGIRPTVLVHGGTSQAVAASPGTAVIQAGVNDSVPAGGTTAFRWQTTAFAPVAATGGVPSSYGYDVGATIRLSDGSTIYATTAQLTVSPS